MYDAIIVGARCAGSPLARLLARKGYRVLLVDRDTFPSDALSTHVIKIPGGALLKRWGLLDKVTATNCPPISRITFDLGPFALTGSAPAMDGVDSDFSPRRHLLDKILVDAAAEAGAELREAFNVQEVLTEGDRVTGIRGHSRNGATVTEKARIVIGADGMRSLVAHTVNAPEYNSVPALTCGYYTYWSGVGFNGAEIYPRDRRSVIAFPTNDDLMCVLVQWPNSEFHRFRSDIEKNYLETLELAPSLAERVRGGRREDRFYGTADLPNFFRKPYGKGWALVGDAGCHKDPITAQGITDAFRDAELLAGAIDEGLSGSRPVEEAMADYETRRNQSAMPIYEFTCSLAKLEPPPPELRQLFAALRGNQPQTDRFIGAIVGTVPLPEFFSPENVGLIMGAATQGGFSASVL